MAGVCIEGPSRGVGWCFGNSTLGGWASPVRFRRFG